MVISGEVLSVNVGGTHKNSTLQADSDVASSEVASTDYHTDYLLVPKATSDIVSPLVTETSTCTWLKEEEKWNIKCYITPSTTDDDNDSYDIENHKKVMSRESRHVHVVGLPDVTEERVAGFFGTFGRVQKTERLPSGGVVVSFMDVRSAQKAYTAVPKLDGHQLWVTFYDQSKNGLVNASVSSSGGIVSPQNANSRMVSCSSDSTRRRSLELHSPGSSSSKKDRTQHSMSSSSRRSSHERVRNSSRNDDRQRRRPSVERRMINELRTSRRSRRSPKLSESSESSRDSPSPSGGSYHHHHHSSSSHTVASTVVKINAPIMNSRRNETSETCSASQEETPGAMATLQGMQGVYVSNLPSSRSESSLKDHLNNSFRKFGKIIHIAFDMETGPNFVERRALLLFQRLSDVDKLFSEFHYLLGLRLKIKLAPHVDVTEAYNSFLSATSAQASGVVGNGSTVHENTSHSKLISKDSGQETSSSSAVDSYCPRASRTLYVGGLERRVSDDSLRARFGHFGHILEIDVKNWESPQPFAFIQFADIQSVVRAINAQASGGKIKSKTNWGRSIVTNKIWIGELPSSCSSDYLREKMRVSFTDTFKEVIYDPRHHEALLLFTNNESASRAHVMIKQKLIAFWNADDKKDVHVPVDYCSEKLHDYFVDRKFRGDRETGSTALNGTGPVANSITCVGLAIASTSSPSSILAPPPDPPSQLRESSSRTDQRKSNSVSRNRKADDRCSKRNNSHSSSRYSSYNRSRRRRERARRSDNFAYSSTSSSSTTTESDSSSRSSSSEKKRTETNRSRTFQRAPNSNEPRKDKEQISANCSATRRPHSPSPTSLAQLLPPPMPSAAILKPEASNAEGLLNVFERISDNQKNESQQEVCGGSGLEELSEKHKKREQKSEMPKTGPFFSQGCARDEELKARKVTSNEQIVISHNKIEEIANTLVNVFQHHTKAAASSNRTESGTHSEYGEMFSRSFTPRHREESRRRGCYHPKRTKWPWGADDQAEKTKSNDGLKTHPCAIPLDSGVYAQCKDPRRRSEIKISCNLPLPKFACDVPHENTKRQRSLTEKSPSPSPSPSPLQHAEQTRSSTSFSDDAMLSPDMSQQSTFANSVDIFGESFSVINNANAYKERLDALGATFQNLEENVQKTKLNTNLDYEKKSTTQRLYRFEEELERLKSRTASSSSSSATLPPTTSLVSFIKARDTLSTTDDFKQFSAPKPIRPPLAISTTVASAGLSQNSTNVSLSSTQNALGNRRTATHNSLPVGTVHPAIMTAPLTSQSIVSTPISFGVPTPLLPHSSIAQTLPSSGVSHLSSTPLLPHTSTVQTFPSSGVLHLSGRVSTPSVPPPPPPPSIVNDDSSSAGNVLIPAIRPSTKQQVASASPAISAPFSWKLPASSKPSTPPLSTPLVVAPTYTTEQKTKTTFNIPKVSGTTSVSLESEKSRPQERNEKHLVKERRISTSVGPKLGASSEKKAQKEFSTRTPSLSELFRQQAQDSSEFRKKQLKKVKLEGVAENKRRKEGGDIKKSLSNPRDEKYTKTAVEKEKSPKRLVRVEKRSTDDGHQQQGKKKMGTQKGRDPKESSKKESEKEGSASAGKSHREGSTANSVLKKKVSVDSGNGKEKMKEKNRKDNELEKDKPGKQKDEKLKEKKERARERKRNELMKKKRRKVEESSSSDSSDGSTTSSEETSFDREVRRLMKQEAAMGTLGLSMYDRVKQRSSARPDDAAKKHRALELLQERTKNRRCSVQKRTRVQLESSSEEVSDDAGGSESSSSLLTVVRGRRSRKTQNEKGKTVKKGRKKKQVSDESDSDEESGKQSGSSASDSEDDRRSKSARGLVRSSAGKKKKKKSNISMDDVFGAYSTDDDESTQHSRVSIVPSLLKEKEERERKKLLEIEKEKARQLEMKVREKEKETKKEKSTKFDKEKKKTEDERKLKKVKSTQSTEKMEKSIDAVKVEKCIDAVKVEKCIDTVKAEKSIDPVKAEKSIDTVKAEKSIDPVKAEKSIDPVKAEKSIDVLKKKPKLKATAIIGTVYTTSEPPKKKQKMAKTLFDISIFPDVKKADKKNKEQQLKQTVNRVASNERYEKKLARKLRKEQKEREDIESKDADEKKTVAISLGSKSEDDVEVTETEKGTTIKTEMNNAKTENVSRGGEHTLRKRGAIVEANETKPKKIKENDKESVEEPPRSETEPSDVDRSGDMVAEVGLGNERSKNSVDILKSESMTECELSDTRFNAGKIREDASESFMEVETVPTKDRDLQSSHSVENPSSQSLEVCEERSDETVTKTVVKNNVTDVHTLNDSCAANNSVRITLAADISHANAQPSMSDDEEEVDGDSGRSSASSSDSGSGESSQSEVSTSSATLETQLEDGIEEKSCPNNIEQTSEKRSEAISQDVAMLATGKMMMSFAPSSDAETAAVPVAGVAESGDTGIGDMDVTDSVSVELPVDAANDAESSGSYELLDEGRISDILDDDEMACDNHTASTENRKQDAREDGEQNAELVEEQVEQFSALDVHDVQETEDAVQSIALVEDSASHQSGDENSMAMDLNYVSEGETSRRSSLQDSTLITIEENAELAKQPTSDVQESEHEECQSETKLEERKASDTHVDEVIDDVVAGGYMEVDAEHLKRISSKKAKEEADRVASQQNTPQSVSSFISDRVSSCASSSATPLSGYDYSHQSAAVYRNNCIAQQQQQQQQSQYTANYVHVTQQMSACQDATQQQARSVPLLLPESKTHIRRPSSQQVTCVMYEQSQQSKLPEGSYVVPTLMSDHNSQASLSMDSTMVPSKDSTSCEPGAYYSPASQQKYPVSKIQQTQQASQEQRGQQACLQSLTNLGSQPIHTFVGSQTVPPSTHFQQCLQQQVSYDGVQSNVATGTPQMSTDLSKQMASVQFQPPVTSPYDLYANLPKKQPQQQQQQQQQQQVNVQQPSHQQTHAQDVTRVYPSANASNSAILSSSAAQCGTRPPTHTQLSPNQQALVFAMGSTTPFAAQMQHQYLQQVYRNSLLQGGVSQSSDVMRSYILHAATNAYGGAVPGSYCAQQNTYPSSGSASGVATGPVAGTQQTQTLDSRQQQFLSPYQHATPPTLCSPQQANIAVAQQQLSSFYGTSPFPVPCESPVPQNPHEVLQPGNLYAGTAQKTQEMKEPIAVTKKQQPSKTFSNTTTTTPLSRYPMVWQGILALKTNEALVQLHRIAGSVTMLSQSLKQFGTMNSSGRPLIRINQRMRMEAGQLESVQSKMVDEHSFIAMLCLSCGTDKDDIRHQSEMLKERFVDYLESKQAAGICNVGNEQYPTPNSIVHIFPPCDFATLWLHRSSPDLFETVRQQQANYLFVVITTAS